MIDWVAYHLPIFVCIGIEGTDRSIWKQIKPSLHKRTKWNVNS